MKILPIGQTILVEPIEDDREVDTIFIPDVGVHRPTKGRVVTLGTGGLDATGQPIPFKTKPGDIIIYPKVGGYDVKGDSKAYKILDENTIMAVLESSCES